MKTLNSKRNPRYLSPVLPLAAGVVMAASVAMAAGVAMAASEDYFVHTEPYNPSGSQPQPWSITVGGLNGSTLTPPDDACGMRFEGDWNLQWHSDNYGLTTNIPADGEADVWLPQPGCGAWDSVVVEPAGEPFFSPPYDFAGYIETHARAYWINASGEKLIYAHQPCHPMPKCIMGPQGFVSKGWSGGLVYPFHQIKHALDLLDGSLSEAIDQIERAADAVDKAAAQLKQQFKYRRRYDTGSLERPIRQLENSANRYVAVARRSLAKCSGAFEGGDSETAYRACNTALTEIQAARTALDTGEAWVEWSNPSQTIHRIGK